MLFMTSCKLELDKNVIWEISGGKKVTPIIYNTTKKKHRVNNAAMESLILNFPILILLRRFTIGIPNKAKTKEIIKYTTTFVNKYTNTIVANKVMIGILYFFKLIA